MDQQTSSIKSPLELLKGSYEKMKAEFESLSQEKINLETLIKYHSNKSQQNLKTQKNHYESILKDLNKTIQHLQVRCKEHELEQNQKSRKQIRKYVENINQKQAQINSLKRQIHSLKTKITSQQQEINNLNNTKQNYQIFVFKGIDQIKLHIKQTATQLQDLQTEKMVLVTKFRQHNEKVMLLENQIYGLESKKKILEQNYQNLKVLHKKSRDQYIDLKFQISRLKECGSLSNDYTKGLQTRNDETLDLYKELKNTIEVNQAIDKCEALLRQTNNFAQMNNQLVNQNEILKIKVENCQFQLDELRCKYESGYQNEYLKNRQPSVYEYLLQKKNKFEHFQQTIEKIQNYIEAKDCDINQILRCMMQKELKCSCGKDEELSELKKQQQNLKIKLESWTDLVQKSKKQKVEMEHKIELYRQQIRNTMKNQGKKGKKTVIRCNTCMLQIQKNEKSQVCQDCKNVLHVQKCSLQHHCGSFVYQDSISVAQSNFFA